MTIDMQRGGEHHAGLKGRHLAGMPDYELRRWPIARQPLQVTNPARPTYNDGKR